MLNTGFGFVAVILLGILLVAAGQEAWAAWPGGDAVAQIRNVVVPTDTGGGSQSGGPAASVSASATATSTGSAAGQGTCSAESSSEAEVRIGDKVVRRSAHKRATQSASGCTARSEASAQANMNSPSADPSGPGEPGTTPER